MEVTLRLPRRTSYADYLAAEQGSDHRHEFLDGVIVAMAGSSAEHNAIAGRLAGLLGNRTAGSCRYYTSGQRFWIASRVRSRYADGSIICGAPDYPVHDDRATTSAASAIGPPERRKPGRVARRQRTPGRAPCAPCDVPTS